MVWMKQDHLVSVLVAPCVIDTLVELVACNYVLSASCIRHVLWCKQAYGPKWLLALFWHSTEASDG